MRTFEMYCVALIMMLTFKKNTLGSRWLEICYGVLGWLYIVVLYYAFTQ